MNAASAAVGSRLPAFDSHQRVREAAFALLLANGEPVSLADLERLTGVGAGLAPMLDEFAALGWIDRDQSGRITGSAGLSLSSGPHRLELRDRPYRTWCGYDALGIAAALGEDAALATTCPVCEAAIVLTLTAGRPAAARRERLFLAVGGADLRADFCAPTVVLCSEEDAVAWSNHSAGRILTLEAAADLGAAAWARCADASRVIDP
ncbi:MAG: organomercurial lyase [Candidatus Limnocylindrales bacterium]